MISTVSPVVTIALAVAILGEPFTVSSVTSDKLGRLLFLRVRNQNGLVINLPSPVGRDFDFGATPMLLTVGGRDIVVNGQKSGHVWALGAAQPGGVRRSA